MITIPQGGNIAGRAAQLTPAPASDLGGVIADVGSAVAEKFGAIKAQQDQVAMQRTQLDITLEAGREVQRFNQMTDPAQIEAEWPVFVQGLQDKYVNATGPDGKPLLTPEQSAALGLTIQDLTTRHGLALGDRAIALTQSQQTAAWIEAKADITTEAATADPDTLLAMIELGEGAIDQRLANGLIMPDDAATEKAAFRAEVYGARLTSAISADPARALADLQAGEYNDLGAETVASRIVSAQTEIDRRAAAAIKADEAAIAEQNRAIGERLTTMTALFGKGATVADEDMLNDPLVQSHPDYPKAVAARDLARETPGIRQMTPAQLDAAIAAERAAPKSETYQTERLDVLTAWRDAAAKGWTTDPVAQARTSELAVPPIDVADPASLATGLAQRLTFATTLQQQGYVRDPRAAVLDEAERTALRAITAPDADVQPKLDLAMALAQGTGGNPEFLTRIIGADPVFAEATRLMVETGSSEVAASMLRGQQRVATDAAIVPPKGDQIALFNDITGGVFEDDPRASAQIRAAAEALFADTVFGLDVADPNNAQAVNVAYSTAVQRVTGATPDANGDLTVGGVQPLRDGMVRLPPGVPLADVETALESVEGQLRGWLDSDTADQPLMDDLGQPLPRTNTPDPLRALRAASVDGRVPALAGLDPDDNGDLFASLQIEPVPGTRDQYRFVYPQGGRPTILGDANGLEYRFRMADLIRGALQ
jgi:hypothetical protein